MADKADLLRITEYLDLDLGREQWHCNRCGRALGPGRGPLLRTFTINSQFSQTGIDFADLQLYVVGALLDFTRSMVATGTINIYMFSISAAFTQPQGG